MASILSLAQQAADELSEGRPTALISVTDSPFARKMLRYLTRTCRALGDRIDWQALRREQTFSTVAAVQQTGALPSDFRRFVQRTMFNRTRRRPLFGPLTAEQWQDDLARGISRSDQFYMVRGGQLFMSPTPAAGETIAFEYITSTIGFDVTGATRRTDFVADDDVPYFDDELLVLGLVWRHRQGEGLDYAEPFRDFELRLADLYKMDGGSRVFRMDSEPDMRRGDGFYGGPGNTDYSDLETP